MHASIAPLAAICALVVGCASGGDPTRVSAAPDATTDTGSADSGTDAADADTSTPSIPDGDATDAIDAETAPEPIDCVTGAFGPSSYSLIDFVYEVHQGSPGCVSSACPVFLMVDPSCTISLQIEDVKTSATLTPTDCEAFKRWVTSDLLVTKLRDTVTCYFSSGAGPGAFESTFIELADGAAGKKTWFCSDEPFSSHRACMNKFRSKYFPGK